MSAARNAVTDESQVDACIGAAELSCLRAGLLFCADLRTALTALLGEPLDLDSINASTHARDLLGLWVSPRFMAVLAELGTTR